VKFDFTLSEIFCVDVMFFYKILYLSAVIAAYFGCPSNISSGFIEDVFQKAIFDIPDNGSCALDLFSLKVFFCEGWFHGIFKDFMRKSFYGYNPISGKDNGMLNNIFQFTDIPRPIIRLKDA